MLVDTKIFRNVDEKNLNQVVQFVLPLLSTGSILLLKGDLGSGKTTVTKELVVALGGDIATVSSPTFNILQIYTTKRCDVWHVDLYRLSSPDELHSLGLEDGFATAITIIEWPDVLEGFLNSEKIINISIEFEEDSSLRKFRIY